LFAVHHASDQIPDIAPPESVARATSAAAIWAPLRPFIAGERRLGEFVARRPWTAPAYEFFRFGLKQGWACLFGGIAVALMIATYKFYPSHAPLAYRVTSSFRGARRASPESITTAEGYGLRSRAKRRVPE
jgi:hypothetical protein